MNVSATHVAIFRVVKTLIPLKVHEFLISENNLIVIPVFKKVFGSFVLSDITFCDFPSFASGTDNKLGATFIWLINAVPIAYLSKVETLLIALNRNVCRAEARKPIFLSHNCTRIGG
jgi:hypothetical protein